MEAPTPPPVTDVLTCPNCDSSYEVPKAVLQRSRVRLRCNVCQEVFPPPLEFQAAAAAAATTFDGLEPWEVPSSGSPAAEASTAAGQDALDAVHWEDASPGAAPGPGEAAGADAPQDFSLADIDGIDLPLAEEAPMDASSGGSSGAIDLPLADEGTPLPSADFSSEIGLPAGADAQNAYEGDMTIEGIGQDSLAEGSPEEDAQNAYEGDMTIEGIGQDSLAEGSPEEDAQNAYEGDMASAGSGEKPLEQDDLEVDLEVDMDAEGGAEALPLDPPPMPEMDALISPPAEEAAALGEDTFPDPLDDEALGSMESGALDDLISPAAAAADLGEDISPDPLADEALGGLESGALDDLSTLSLSEAEDGALAAATATPASAQPKRGLWQRMFGRKSKAAQPAALQALPTKSPWWRRLWRKKAASPAISSAASPALAAAEGAGAASLAGAALMAPGWPSNANPATTVPLMDALSGDEAGGDLAAGLGDDISLDDDDSSIGGGDLGGGEAGGEAGGDLGGGMDSSFGDDLQVDLSDGETGGDLAAGLGDDISLDDDDSSIGSMDSIGGGEAGGDLGGGIGGGMDSSFGDDLQVDLSDGETGSELAAGLGDDISLDDDDGGLGGGEAGGDLGGGMDSSFGDDLQVDLSDGETGGNLAAGLGDDISLDDDDSSIGGMDSIGGGEAGGDLGGSSGGGGGGGGGGMDSSLGDDLQVDLGDEAGSELAAGLGDGISLDDDDGGLSGGGGMDSIGGGEAGGDLGGDMDSSFGDDLQVDLGDEAGGDTGTPSFMQSFDETDAGDNDSSSGSSGGGEAGGEQQDYLEATDFGEQGAPSSAAAPVADEDRYDMFLRPGEAAEGSPASKAAARSLPQAKAPSRWKKAAKWGGGIAAAASLLFAIGWGGWQALHQPQHPAGRGG